MLTFFRKPVCRGRSATGGSQQGQLAQDTLTRGGGPYGDPARPGVRNLRAQDGFQLIEVMITALITGLIAIATFTGLQSVNRSTSDQRDHNAASLLASQSQEELRSAPASTLEALEISSHVYTQTVNGATFTVTQKAEALGETGQGTTCTVATESQHGVAPNVRISSSVTWPQLRTGRPAVSQSSIITPPAGSSLEIDVLNSEAATIGISGVTALIKYTPLETTSTVTREGTTSGSGCVLFGGIRSTSAIVEIVQKPNFVTPSGALKIAPVEVTIAPNVTTHHDVLYDEGGTIQAKFTYEGNTVHSGQNVTGDTFLVANSSMQVPPETELGGTAFKYETIGEQLYTAQPGCTATATCTTLVPYQWYTPVPATTATGTTYATGDLFPFPENSKWSVYAGDCAENNALVVTGGAVKNGLATVYAGKATTVEVPMSYDKLTVLEGLGTGTLPIKYATVTYPIKITNTACSQSTPVQALPNHAAAVSYVHRQSSTLPEGHLEAPFQPFGKAELCLYNATAKKTYRVSYTNTTVAGQSPTIYLGDRSTAEKTTRKTTAEAAEHTQSLAWQKEQSENKLTEANRHTKEASAKSARETTETKENTEESATGITVASGVSEC